MNKIIFPDGNTFDVAPYPIDIEPSILDKRNVYKNEQREMLRITVSSTYADVAQYFVDDATFSIRQFDVDENGNELATYTDYEKTDYVIAGDIIDHRDGRITVYMCKKTKHELEMESLEAENAELLFNVLTGEDLTDVDTTSKV